MESRTAVAIGIGGAAGAVLRWAIGEAFTDAGGWPWAIFIANIVGCLALGFVVGAYRSRLGLSTFVGLTTGFCGALTTFSGFAVDLAVFVRDDRWSLFAGYLAISLVVGLAAYGAGRSAGLSLDARSRAR